jgi:integrase
MPRLKLRQDIVRTIPYRGTGGKGQCVYWDEALESFGLRVHPSGRRMYVCAYRINQRKRLATLGRADAMSLDHARKKAMAYLAKAANQEDPQSNIDAQRQLKTIDELVEAYIEGHAKKKKKTWKEDQSYLKRHVLSKLSGRLAVSLVTADMEAIHSQLGVEHPYGANDVLKIVRKMFNWGKVAGLVPRDHPNIVAGIVRFPERARKRFVTTIEMPRLLQALEQEDNDHARHGIWLLLLMGLRSKELLKAKWEDIDWDMGTLFIGLTKNGEPLLAPISDAAMDRLRVIPRISDNPYIICGRLPGQYLRGLGGPLRRALKRAGLINLRIHDLRRTVGSWLAQDGQSLHLIGDVLNHRDPKTTAGYAYFQTKQRRDALTGHGSRVLALTPAHLRKPAAPTGVSAHSLLPAAESVPVIATENSVAHYRHYFRREDLYRLVWTSPVSEIAARLGVSDVALAKLCRRAAIPIPGRGYWARTEAGQAVEPVPLQEPPKGLPEWLRIRGTRPATVPRRPISTAGARTQEKKRARIGRAAGKTAATVAAVPTMSGSAS